MTLIDPEIAEEVPITQSKVWQVVHALLLNSLGSAAPCSGRGKKSISDYLGENLKKRASEQ